MIAMASTVEGRQCSEVLATCQHIMMTSSNGYIFRVTDHLCREFTGAGEFPAQRPVMRSFHIFFDLRLNKPLSKQSWGWWFETLSPPLWRHGNVLWQTGKDQMIQRLTVVTTTSTCLFSTLDITLQKLSENTRQPATNYGKKHCVGI